MALRVCFGWVCEVLVWVSLGGVDVWEELGVLDGEEEEEEEVDVDVESELSVSVSEDTMKRSGMKVEGEGK